MTGGEPWRMPRVAVEVMESLYQHRLLDTNQIRAMHAPTATSRWTQRLLATLARRDLVAAARAPGALRAWYLTAAGADAVEAIPTRAEPRRRLVTAAQAAGQLQQHTLAVNHVGIAYLHATRQRGDEFGPLSWRHEIAHPISDHRREVVIADALISYLIADEHTVAVEQRFLELDRGTIPVEQLVAKLDRYQRLRRYTPPPPPGEELRAAWHAYYPAFPKVQIVLAHKPRPVLERRAGLVLALAAANHQLAEDRALATSICLLDDLVARGPFAAIWLPVADPTRRVDWLGHTDSAQQAVRA